MREVYQPDLLKDTHIVVTGGGTGLGRAMAIRCAELGARVSICGRRAEPLQETVEAIQAAGGEATWETCNVREQESVESFLQTVESRLGPVTGLINNAAANFLAATERLSPGGFDAIVKTNLYGTFYFTQACGRRWIDGGINGSVVSIVTTYAETGSAFVVPSAASKAGIVALTRSLAVEWGVYGIRLNAIAPGPFPTKGAWERLMVSKELEDMMRQRIPLRRFGDPRELANLAAFLLSEASSFITGEVVTIDGGEKLSAGGQFNYLAQLPREQLLAMLEAMRKK